MKRKIKARLLWAAGLLFAFILFTILVNIVNVRAIGPLASSVGFAEINGYFHSLTGVNMFLYDLTDLLSIVPLGIASGFAFFGLAQLIKRKSLKKIDTHILILGGFYLLVLGVFLLFEVVVINFRPVLIEGVLEASYPSSTTVLVLCVMLSTSIYLRERIKRRSLRVILLALIYAFTAFMVAARLLSGVHWLSDIVGGVLLSEALLMFFSFFFALVKEGKRV